MRELYRVPSRIDQRSTVWYRCLTAMQFTDDRVGWAVGSAQIIRTTDSGRRWTNVFDENMLELAFAPKKLSAPTQNLCWTIDTVGSGKTKCLFTLDGGQSWLPFGLDSSQFPRDVFFFTAQRGWLICDNGTIEGGAP